MTLWPYLIAKGWLPYKDIAIAHTPHLLISLSSVYRIFGVGIIQLKIYTWALIILTDLIVYFVAKKGWGKKTAILSLLAFVLWQLFFDGNGLWFDLILAPISLITFYFLGKKHYFWTGMFWTFMLFNKQTAIWFLIPIIFSVVKDILEQHSNKASIKIVRNLFGGVLVTLTIWICGLWIWGVLPSFYNWAINFGIFVLPKASGQVQLPALKNIFLSGFPFLVFIPFLLSKEKYKWNLLLWTIAGCLGAYPRFEYFHFQPAVPYLAITTGIFLSSINWKNVPIRLFTIVYGLSCLSLFSGFFMRNFKEGVRFYERDVQDVVSYVKSNTNPGDKIFVMNWWDNVYALSDRLPATDPWVPQLSWYMEALGIQEKIVNDLIVSKPKLIILNSYSETGLSAYIPQKVYNYVTTNYILREKVDEIEILVPKK